jgi:flavin-dependent dehydrogenase
MHSCDVLIVGGGPAGSSCAWGLRSAGLEVLVVDKARFPRNKVCGGWITVSVLESLGIHPDDYRLGHTLQPITGFRISSMGQKETEIDYEQIVSYGIRRCEFDEYLLRRCGIHIREESPVTSIERFNNAWIVNGEIRARLLVGAGGHFCPVSRHIGNTNHEDPVVAQEIEFEMTPEQSASCNIRPEIPELYFCDDLKGYGWCFRKNDFINIGLGRMDPNALPHHMEQFLRLLRTAGKIGFELPARPAGHAYLLFGSSRRKIVDDAIMLIGDSAGLAYEQSGEGIRPAVESGLLAAEVITSSQGSYNRARLAAYSDLLVTRLNPRDAFAEKIAKHLPPQLRNGLARMLLKTKWFCRRVILDRWFLH